MQIRPLPFDPQAHAPSQYNPSRRHRRALRRVPCQRGCRFRAMFFWFGARLQVAAPKGCKLQVGRMLPRFRWQAASVAS